MFLPEVSLGDDEFLQRELAVCAGEHLTLHRVRRSESKDVHGFRLADAVTTIHRLHVLVRIPVAVVDDHRVGRREVDPQTTRASGEQEDAE